MGFFSGKKTTPEGDGVYVDMEGQKIPIAIAVHAPPPSPRSAPGALQQQGYSSKQAPVQASRQGGSGSTVYNTKNGKPPPILFLSRTPTVIALCPVCNKKNVRTRIVTAPDWLTWVTVAVLLVVFWPLCWVPLVTDSCRRTTHYCIACSAEVGSIRPFKDCFVKHR